MMVHCCEHDWVRQLHFKEGAAVRPAAAGQGHVRRIRHYNQSKGYCASKDSYEGVFRLTQNKPTGVSSQTLVKHPVKPTHLLRRPT
jgi:hypothetical protein